MKCPALPPFDDGAAWQAVRIQETPRLLLHSKIPQHFNAVHAVTDTKGKVATPEKEVKKPSQSSRGDPGPSKGPHSAKINDQHRDASHCINTEVRESICGL